MTDLFANEPPPRVNEPLEEGAMVLRGFVTDPAAMLDDWRHGVSRIRSGGRHTLDIIFHDVL